MLSRLMTIREQLLLLGLGAAIVLGAGVLIWRGNTQRPPAADTFAARPEMKPGSAPPAMKAITATPAVPQPAPATPPAAPAAAPARIGVGIMGAVKRSGLYFFDPGARVQDLLDSAGGALAESDLSDINRTALLIDETTLLVPRLVTNSGQTYSDPPVTCNPAPYTRSAWYPINKQAPAATGPSSASTASTHAAPAGLININTASQSELESLPGIGPATAQKIIAHRQSQPFNTPEDLENVSGIGPAKMAAVRALITVK